MNAHLNILWGIPVDSNAKMLGGVLGALSIA
jgi:hypothetical protein